MTNARCNDQDDNGGAPIVITGHRNVPFMINVRYNDQDDSVSIK